MAMCNYTYLKPRSEFGKQCIFDYKEPVAEECILPNPEDRLNYILRTQCVQHVQNSTQTAVHEAQTLQTLVKNTGMLHLEGGWPREIQVNDNEAVYRYRRRVERDDKWAPSMRTLLERVEYHVLQNNTVNIHQYYFEDMIPTSFVKEYNMRVTNCYQDPQLDRRPVRCLSWSPNSSNRLAAAYAFGEFEQPLNEASLYCYIWDIEDSNKALSALQPHSPLMAIEFNPRDPSALISGLMSGEVCSWDIRVGNKPVQVSHPYFSHRSPANQALWVSSKANTEFFSSSINGTVMWWDTRFLTKPTDTIVMDLDNPQRSDILSAVGVSALQFESTISSRFLAGMENGLVVNVNKRGVTATEKLTMRFNGYTGPIVTVDRNPFFTRNFLSVGDWSAKVWADDTKEDCLLTVCDKKADLSGGCWSRSRCSVFYTINTKGLLAVYDILSGIRKPIISIHVCSNKLTAISSQEQGKFLAVGSHKGNIYLLDSSEDLKTFTKSDRALLATYFERWSNFEKTVDIRAKEASMRASEEVEASPIRKSKQKSSKSDSRDRKRDKLAHSSTKAITESSKMRKSRAKKSRDKTGPADPELAIVEENYLQAIEKISTTFTEIDKSHVKAAEELLRQRVVQPPKKEGKGLEKSDSRTDRRSLGKRGSRRFRSRIRTWSSFRKFKKTTTDDESSIDADLESEEKRVVKGRRARSLKVCPTKVCKPNICCRDMKEASKSATSKSSTTRSYGLSERTKSFLMQEKLFRKLFESFHEIPRQSFGFKRDMLIRMKAPPNVLLTELEEAKREVRVWQEKLIAGQLSFRAVQKKIGKTVEIQGESEPEAVAETKEIHVATPKRKKEFRRRRTRRKKREISEELKKEQEEKQRELWKMLKQKAKEQDAKIEKIKYPRLSAAFAGQFLEDAAKGKQ